MLITYDYTNEGVGAQYLRVINLIALCKIHNYTYLYNQIKIGHNYNNDSKWDLKWDNFFNIKSFIPDNYDKFKHLPVINIKILEESFLNEHKNENNIYSINIPFKITNNIIYYNSIKNDIIEAFKNNNYIPKNNYFDKNKFNIAIHIRVFNNCDDEHQEDDYNNSRYRFEFSENDYFIIIRKIQLLYPDGIIHIFSQKLIYRKFKNLCNLPNIQFHIDCDTFETFYHLTKANLLIIAKSAFSHLAGYYNENTVVYLGYDNMPLNDWINIHTFLNIS